MLRKSFLLLVSAFLVLGSAVLIVGGGASVASAQQGNGGPCDNPGQGNPPQCPTSTTRPTGNGGPCNNPGQGRPPQCQYPANANVEIRNAAGELINADVGLVPGDPMNIVAGGWQPGAVVSFTFFSDPIHLGQKTVDSDGYVRATYAVPNVAPGLHTLRMTGIGVNLQPRTVDWPVRVLARPTSVAGATLDRARTASASSSGFGRTGAFGKTGLSSAEELAQVGFALFAVGAALVLAVRKSRRRSPAL